MAVLAIALKKPFATLVIHGASAARVAVADPISGGNVTAKKCHRQGIRRFLAAQRGARNAVSYTKRRRVRTSESAVRSARTHENRVPNEGANGRGQAQPVEHGSWHLACSFTNPTNRLRDDQRPETLGGRDNE